MLALQINHKSIVKHVIMMNEEIVKKRSDFRLGVEGWSTGFEVVECETKWHDTITHGKKKCSSIRVMVITVTHNRYVQISSAQQAVTASICNTVLDPVVVSCSHVNCFLPNMGIAMLTPGK